MSIQHPTDANGSEAEPVTRPGVEFVRELPPLPKLDGGEWSVRLNEDRSAYAAHPRSPLLVCAFGATEWTPMDVSDWYPDVR